MSDFEQFALLVVAATTAVNSWLLLVLLYRLKRLERNGRQR